ncbi:MAG: Sulfur carrier protein ThiS [Syntrophaceae bacterium PtaU1.Bin231]|nr:MAG: Sulfur carrier protein ThiS [Syntrophaceae bacterium PtaU1.Bin231]
MKIRINGRDETLERPVSLEELLEEKGLMPERVVIEYNLEIVSRDRWPRIVLREGDRVEIVSFVGGG